MNTFPKNRGEKEPEAHSDPAEARVVVMTLDEARCTTEVIRREKWGLYGNEVSDTLWINNTIEHTGNRGHQTHGTKSMKQTPGGIREKELNPQSRSNVLTCPLRKR